MPVYEISAKQLCQSTSSMLPEGSANTDKSLEGQGLNWYKYYHMAFWQTWTASARTPDIVLAGHNVYHASAAKVARSLSHRQKSSSPAPTSSVNGVIGSAILQLIFQDLDGPGTQMFRKVQKNRVGRPAYLDQADIPYKLDYLIQIALRI